MLKSSPMCISMPASRWADAITNVSGHELHDCSGLPASHRAPHASFVRGHGHVDRTDDRLQSHPDVQFEGTPSSSLTAHGVMTAGTTVAKTPCERRHE